MGGGGGLKSEQSSPELVCNLNFIICCILCSTPDKQPHQKLFFANMSGNAESRVLNLRFSSAESSEMLFSYMFSSDLVGH